MECVCVQTPYTMYVPDVVCYCPERYIFLHTLLLQAVSHNMERLTFCLSCRLKLKKLNGGIELQCVDDQFRDEKKNKNEKEIRTR
jgi:hypothetical protein